MRTRWTNTSPSVHRESSTSTAGSPATHTALTLKWATRHGKPSPKRSLRISSPACGKPGAFDDETYATEMEKVGVTSSRMKAARDKAIKEGKDGPPAEDRAIGAWSMHYGIDDGAPRGGDGIPSPEPDDSVDPGFMRTLRSVTPGAAAWTAETTRGQAARMHKLQSRALMA